MTTRGIKNNNPGNLVIDPKNKWQGLSDVQDDPRFCVFKDAKWGIRALARVLIAYQDKHDLNTVTGIITKFAPPTENDTASYIKAVAAAVGVEPDAEISVHDYATLRPMIEDIIRHENNIHDHAPLPYNNATIEAGLILAGVTPPARVVPNKSMATGTIVASAAAVTTMVSQVSDTMQTITPSLPMVAKVLHMIPPWSLGAVLCMGVALLIFERFKVLRRLGQ